MSIQKPTSLPAWHSALCLLLGLGLSANGQAQTPPNAGDVLRNNVPPANNSAPRNNVSLPGQVSPDQLSDNTTPLTIRHARIEGATVFTEAQLLPLVADLLGGTRTLADWQQGAARISQHYRQAGYFVARAYLPQQSLAQGRLTIRVLEGTLGKVRLDGAQVGDTPLARYLSRVPIGSPLQRDTLDRALLILGEVPGVDQVRSRIEPGERTGETSLVVETTAAPQLSGYLGVDNYGSLYTGRARVSAGAELSNAWGLGEKLSGQLTASDHHMWLGQLGLQVPLGNDGLIAHVGGNRTQYSLGSSYASLNAYGVTHGIKSGLRYPLLRATNKNLYLTAGGEYREMHDVISSTSTITDKHASFANLGLQGDWEDAWQGLTSAGMTLTQGRLKILSPSALALDQSAAKTNGRYTRLNWNLGRRQTFASGWDVSLQAQGQWAQNNLNSSDKFALGGAYGVRAYPSGEATGDAGWSGTLDVRYPLHPQLKVGAFYDIGSVKVNAKPYLSTPNKQTLAGVGLGLYGGYKDMSFSAVAAWRTKGGSPTAESDRVPRIWVSVNYRF